MQLAAEQALREGLQGAGGPHARSANGPASIPRARRHDRSRRPATSARMVGGYDFFRSEFNRAVQARRQPGSAFKPFVYIAALESGFTAATRVEDAPVSYAVGRSGKVWKPENYDRKFRGPTTLQQALEESVNVVTVEGPGAGRRQPHRSQVARRLGDHQPARREPQPGARHLRPDAARADVGLRRARQPGPVAAPDDDPLRARTRRASCSRSTCRRAGRRSSPETRLRDHPHAARRGRAGHRPGGARRWAGPIAAKTGHDQRLLERVVHRLHAARSPPACGSATTARGASARTRRAHVSRCRSGSAYMSRVLGGQPRGRLPDARARRAASRSTWTRRTSACGSVTMAFVRGTEPAASPAGRADRASPAATARRERRPRLPPARRRGLPQSARRRQRRAARRRPPPPAAAPAPRPPLAGTSELRPPAPVASARPSGCVLSAGPRLSPSARRIRRRDVATASVEQLARTRGRARPIGTRICSIESRSRIVTAGRHLALLGVADRLDVDGHAVGRADLVLPPVQPPDRRGVVVDVDPATGPARSRRSWQVRTISSRFLSSGSTATFTGASSGWKRSTTRFSPRTSSSR